MIKKSITDTSRW